MNGAGKSFIFREKDKESLLKSDISHDEEFCLLKVSPSLQMNSRHRITERKYGKNEGRKDARRISRRKIETRAKRNEMRRKERNIREGRRMKESVEGRRRGEEEKREEGKGDVKKREEYKGEENEQ